MKNLKVLLIDDDEDDREVFTSAMAALPGCPQCISLEDAGEALLALEEKMLDPDVIFLDLNMPKMDGKDFFLKMKARQNLMHIPIVIFSTSSFRRSVNSKELDAATFIAKPDTFSELKVLLQDYLDQNFSELQAAV